MSNPTGILWKPTGGKKSHLQKVESWNCKTASHFFSVAKSKFHAPSYPGRPRRYTPLRASRICWAFLLLQVWIAGMAQACPSSSQLNQKANSSQPGHQNTFFFFSFFFFFKQSYLLLYSPSASWPLSSNTFSCDDRYQHPPTSFYKPTWWIKHDRWLKITIWPL